MAFYLGSGQELKAVIGGELYSITSKSLDDSIYSLEKPVSFNGTSDYIDTGIKLGEVDADYTIMIDISKIVTFGNQLTVLNYMNEASPYPGLCVRVVSSGIEAVLGSTRLFTVNGIDSSGIKIVITRDATSKIYSAYWSYNSTTSSSSSRVAFYSSPQTLTIGSSKNGSNAPWRFFKGTVNSFKLYDKVLPDERITKFLEGGN